MKIRKLLWGTCLFFVFQSCQKTGEVNDKSGDQINTASLIDKSSLISGINVNVKNGTLHFIEDKIFFQDIEAINKMSDEEFVAFENELGFKSLSTVLEESYKAFDNVKNMSELKEWEAKYGDVVSLRDSIVTPLVPVSTYQRIVNRSGEYFLGDAYVKIIDGKLVTILDGNKDKLKVALNTKDANGANGIFVDKLIQNLNEISDNSTDMIVLSAAPCGGGYLTAMRQDGNRKVWVDYYVVIFRGIGQYAGEVQVVGSAHKKTWIGWNKYKTRYRIENINFSIVNGKGQTISAYNASGNNNSDSYTYTRAFSLNDVNSIDKYVGPSNFQYASARCVSRGTSPYWAVICCNTSCPSDYGQYY